MKKNDSTQKDENSSYNLLEEVADLLMLDFDKQHPEAVEAAKENNAMNQSSNNIFLEQNEDFYKDKAKNEDAFYENESIDVKSKIGEKIVIERKKLSDLLKEVDKKEKENKLKKDLENQILENVINNLDDDISENNETEVSVMISQDADADYVVIETDNDNNTPQEKTFLDLKDIKNAETKRKRNKKLVATNILNEICQKKHEHINRQKVIITENSLRAHLKEIPPAKGFLSALNNKIAKGKNALIAEIKKASPSKGIIREDFDPANIAKSYQAAGAACISVLTDAPYFQGRDEYIDTVNRACDLPILRKDFILDPYQVTESRALGADCILLIMAALSDNQAKELEEQANLLGMDVLVEVHNEEELYRALELKTMLIGINNRNLKNMKIDLEVTERLSSLIPSPKTVVCESGIYSHSDILRINESRVKAFLVGESLMRQDDITQATKNLLGL